MSPFRPAWWCRGRHAQTLCASVFRPTPSVPLRRERWELPDGDFLDVDALTAAAGAPLLLLLHGLEGCSRSKYALGLLRAARREGWQGLSLNFRSCSGVPNRLRRAYHAGDTADLAWVMQRVIAQQPQVALVAVGISLGGNVLLKYLGEQGEALPAQVRAAAAISTPFDLAASVRALEQGFSRVYMRALVRSLRRKAAAKLRLFPDLVNREALAAARTLTAFDNAFTAPLHGFADADAYWAASSSSAFLARVRRPTLLINAQDDPFLPAEALPTSSVSENHCLTADFPAGGGHVGFLAGTWPGRPVHWAEARTIAFLKAQLTNGQKKVNGRGN